MEEQQVGDAAAYERVDLHDHPPHPDTLTLAAAVEGHDSLFEVLAHALNHYFVYSDTPVTAESLRETCDNPDQPGTMQNAAKISKKFNLNIHFYNPNTNTHTLILPGNTAGNADKFGHELWNWQETLHICNTANGFAPYLELAKFVDQVRWANTPPPAASTGGNSNNDPRPAPPSTPPSEPEFELPASFSRGSDYSGPDAFFEALAERLNTHYSVRYYTAKSLREKCSAYANDPNQNHWLREAFSSQAAFDQYVDNIRFTADDAEKLGASPIEGRPFIDGVILSKIFNVTFHFVNPENNFHALVTPEKGYEPVSPLDAQWDSSKVIHVSAPMANLPRYPSAPIPDHESFFRALARAAFGDDSLDATKDLRELFSGYTHALAERTFSLYEHIAQRPRFLRQLTRDWNWGIAGRIARNLETEITSEYRKEYQQEFAKQLNWMQERLDEDYLNYPDSVLNNPNHPCRLDVEGVIFCDLFDRTLIVHELNDNDETIKTTVVTKNGCIENVSDARNYADDQTVYLSVKNGKFSIFKRKVGDDIFVFGDETRNEEAEAEAETHATLEPVAPQKKLKPVAKTLPSGFNIHAANEKDPRTHISGDPFLASVAYVLNNAIHGTQIVTKGPLEHSEESLREELRKFARALPEKHRLLAINTAHRRDGHEYYYENIERPFSLKDYGQYISGDVERDGPVLSQQLGVDIHVIVAEDIPDPKNPDKTITVDTKHLLCTKDGCHEIDATNAHWTSDKFVTLVTDKKMKKFTPVVSHLPRTLSFKVIDGVVHAVMGGTLLWALLPQGMAAFVVAYSSGTWLSNPLVSTITGIGSVVGKFGLLYYYGWNKWGGFPSTYNGISLFAYNFADNMKNFMEAVATGNWEWEKDLFIPLAKLGAASIPLTLFGLLAYPTVDSFTDTIFSNPAIFGSGFQAFAQFAQTPRALASFFATSAIGNLVSAMPMYNAVWRTGETMLNDYVAAKEQARLGNPYPLRRFYLGAGIGAILTGVACVGFINFGPLAHDSIYTPLFNMHGPFWWLFAGIGWGYTAGAVFTLFGIAFSNAMPLGRKLTERILDAFKQSDIPYDPQNNYESFWSWYTGSSRSQKALMWTSVALALLMVIPGGLPNVWQAEHEGENLVLAVFALVASALAEFEGTSQLIELLLTRAAEVSKNFREKRELAEDAKRPTKYEVIRGDEAQLAARYGFHAAPQRGDGNDGGTDLEERARAGAGRGDAQPPIIEF